MYRHAELQLTVPFGLDLGSDQSSSQLFVLDNVVVDGDVHVVKDVKGVFFIEVRLDGHNTKVFNVTNLIV